MFGKHTVQSDHDTEGESPWISFTDLMAGFLVVILLALTAAIIMLTLEKTELRKEREAVGKELESAREAEEEARLELAEARKKQELAKKERQRMILISEKLIKSIDEVRETQSQIVTTIDMMDDYDEARKVALKEIQSRLAKQNIKVEISKEGHIIHIIEENLSFALGSHEIQKKYSNSVARIGSEISYQIQETALGDIVDTVFVEGHTDNVRNPNDMGNWGLSAYRAISLWNYWQKSDGRTKALHGMKNTKGDALFSVTGYGETRPRIIFDEGSKEDQGVNRRIDLRFNLQAVKSDLLEKLATDVNASLKKIEAIQTTVKEQLKSSHEE